MGVKCPECQHENPDDTLFCGKCGTQFSSPEKAEVTKTLETPKEELTRGSTLANRYEIIEELGKGGMGKVYRVEDTKLKQEVALKLIKPEIGKDEKTIERFRNELKLAREIAHRNVCRMYDLNEEKGTHFITMEYVRGEDLRSLIRRIGQLPVGKSISIATQMCEGLSEAHRLGVVHRDLKSNNIMIDKEGNVRIMDFGIARSLEAKGITGAGVMIGTPEYMSPEQVEGKEVDQRSDLYSLGIILYEMVTGRVPFEGDTPFIIGMKHKGEMPQNPKDLNTQISDDLSRVILKCLEKDKEKRYQSAGEVQSELVNIEKGIPATERIVPKRKPITSREITVTFGLKRLLIPALVVAAIVISAVIIWQLLLQKEPASLPNIKPSVAVLPFEDLSPQKDQGHLCDGMAESIINALTRVKDLRVPAPTSSFTLKSRELNMQGIGEKLNVKTVLRGSIQKAERRVRIIAQLINVDDESLLWSDQYNRELDDIFAIQDEITIAIVDNLKVKLLGEERLKLVKRYTDNPEAYDLYLQGRFHWNRRTVDGMQKSIEYFEKAIKVDPTYALAYAGLADTYIVLGEWGVFRPKETYPKAKSAAMKALEIDDRLAEAHNALAMIKRDFDYDWERAEREFKRALELNSNYPTAHQWYAEYLVAMGRFDEATAEIKRAQELDPLSLVKKTIGGMVYYNSRKFDLGIEQCQKVLDLDPSFLFVRFFLGINYFAKEMYEEAIKEFQLSAEIFLYSQSMLGYAYALSGKRDEAVQILDQLYERSKKNYVSPSSFAFIYAGLGEYDRAMECLEKGYDERDMQLLFLKVSSYFDILRDNPRFQDLLQRMDFPKLEKGE